MATTKTKSPVKPQHGVIFHSQPHLNRKKGLDENPMMTITIVITSFGKTTPDEGVTCVSGRVNCHYSSTNNYCRIVVDV